MYLFSIALTSCSYGATVNYGDVVRFPNVKTNYGLQNLTLFKQTGIFTCEQKGLYMFFSSMMSHTAEGFLRWYLKNPHSLSAIYVGNHDDYQSGSGMVTIELDVGDTVFFKSRIRVDPSSCCTLIKIK
jgi:hypothetical protein